MLTALDYCIDKLLTEIVVNPIMLGRQGSVLCYKRICWEGSVPVVQWNRPKA